MDPQNALSAGAINLIFTDRDRVAETFGEPVVQCLQVRPMNKDGGAGGNDRYRLVLSDSVNYVQCVMGVQMSHIVREGKLQPNSLLRLKTYNPSGVGNKRILILVDLVVLEEYTVTEKIGKPVLLEADASAPPQQQAAPAPAPIAASNFYGAKTEEQKPRVAPPPPRQQTHGGNAGRSNNTKNGMAISKIESLSPYNHKWTIRARVSFKSDIRTWHKPSGEGKLFSVNLLDETGEIKATCFNELVDQYYDVLEQGSVYYISTPCRVNMAKKQFSNLPHEYELAFERDTLIEKAEDQTSVPQVMFNFHTIQGLQSVEKDTNIDVIGVIKDVGEMNSFTSKSTGKPYEKRDITIVDDTNYSVRVTVWGKTAADFDGQPEQVVAFKGVKVSDFNGKSLSLLNSGSLSLDPDHEDAHRLKGWYDSQGRTENFQTYNSMASMGAATGRPQVFKLVGDVKAENVGMVQEEYFNIKGTVVFIRQENFAYPACPTERCNKKVIMDGDGWRCEKCNITHERPSYRYIMSVNVCDHTGQLWLSCFDDVGRVVMGMPGDDLMALREEHGDVGTAPAFENAACRTYNFRVRAKMDTYQDQQRIRYQAMSASALDFKAEGRKLADMIKEMSI
ncbi:Replication factor A protein 1 [Ceratocystis pirilliformis]|uniref:Replication protein A subunit n=1 Tax=Ceratocystis pirilliformis TaxID=259994 RepID=A0ABR3ZI09_9PEZI